MAQKKCPKCGEDNPAEAVMCWACYTPLSGGAAVAASASGGAVAAPMPGAKLGKVPPGGAPGAEGEKKEKLKLEPKQIGIAAAVFVALGLAVFLNLPKASTDEEVVEDQPAPQGGGGGAPAPPPPNPGVVFSGGGPTGPGAMPAPVSLPFTMVVPPNSRYPAGTMAILPTTTPITPKQAASLASFAKGQFLKMKKWSGFQLFVFGNAQAAQTFADYVNQKRGLPLNTADYQALASSNVWSGAVACYDFRGGRESMRYPANNPSGWWGR